MSDIMTPMPFTTLMRRIMMESERYGSVFGVNLHPVDQDPSVSSADLPLNFAGQTLEHGMGVAAGPHTQLAQNLAACYAGGARFLEVKTVQIMYGEELGIPRPCIRAEDEAYNVEWSSEYDPQSAMVEYVKGYVACKIMSREFELGHQDGFAFNMSVGYNLEGIMSPSVDSYIDQMRDVSDTEIWKSTIAEAHKMVDDGMFAHVDHDFIDQISPEVVKTLTLSTMHGTPPAGIEEIVMHLLKNKRCNTILKCNPTLLGYDFARELLDGAGYDYIKFGREQFEHDLQFQDAVPMITRLRQAAADDDLYFACKLTNTFQVSIEQNELPGQDMYMSGKPLYILATNVAKKLSEAFEGTLPLSYSGGADKNNIAGLFEAGIWPVTVCTVLLKNPGINGLNKLSDIARECVSYLGDTNDPARIAELADKAMSEKHVQKTPKARAKVDEHVSYTWYADEEDLYCRTVCASCTKVCPNRCNEVLELDDTKLLMHVDLACNECGTCQFACPDPCKPYRDRITLFADEAAVNNSTNEGFACVGESFVWRSEGSVSKGALQEMPELFVKAYQAVVDQKPYLL